MSDVAKGFCSDERTPFKHTLKNLWLVKPDNLNQGRGIEIFKNIKDII
jgi:hypothetical protein